MSVPARTYSLGDLRTAYDRLGVRPGSTVIIKADLRLLGQYAAQGPETAPAAHFTALADLIDLKKGTIVVTTASTRLCNTQEVFDPLTTPSEMGVMSEYVRSRPGSVRSFHPFLSYCAVGKNARDICMDVSRHGFGMETPKSRLLDLDALFISVGQPPRLTASVVHHAEMLMGVPYRYSKEFLHPVARDGNVGIEPFYMHVWYRECGNDHDGVRKIYDHFVGEGGRAEEQAAGRGKIFSLSLKKYYESTIRALKKDIYMFLKDEPVEKPYRK